MPVSVNEIREKFAQLKYEQLLADKYFIETCFSKNFESRTAREKMDNMKMRINVHRVQREGITMIDCHLPQTGCDSEGMETTTTTTTIAPTTTTTTIAPTTTTTTTVPCAAPVISMKTPNPTSGMFLISADQIPSDIIALNIKWGYSADSLTAGDETPSTLTALDQYLITTSPITQTIYIQYQIRCSSGTSNSNILSYTLPQ